MTYTAHIKDTRVPGGSPDDIKQDYNLDATVNDDGTLTVSGNKEDLECYLEDYSINAEIVAI